MVKHKKLFTVLFFLTVLFSACVQNKTQNLPQTGITVTDCAGRQVIIESPPQRIAALYAYTGHGCALLGKSQNLVAVVTGLKRDNLMKEKVADIENLPAPYSAGAINIEELSAASPDIILLRISNIQNQGEIDKLDLLGIPYVVVDYSNIEQQINSIKVMGQALFENEKAEAYIKYYKNTITFVQERTSQLKPEDKINVYHSVNEATRTDIYNSITYEILNIAGLNNVVTQDSKLNYSGEKAYTTVEQIYLWNPDVVMANEVAAAEYFRTNSNFAALKAVQNGKIIQLPVGISRWGHPGSIETPIAILYIAKTMYPQLFEDVDIQKETKDFYAEYFNISLTDQDVLSIFSGSGMREERGNLQ